MSDDESGDQFVVAKPTLIIFHGPPCSGKTLFYKQYYAKSHVRFSLEEWVSRGPEATLHGGIRRLAKKLKDGDSVVLDDCNPTNSSRASLVAALRKHGAEFELEGVEFRPKGGILQCRVVSQFLAATEAERIESDRLLISIDIDSSDDSEDGEESGDELETTPKRRGLESVLADQSHVQIARRREDMFKNWESTANGLTYPEGFKVIQFLDQDPVLDVKELRHAALLIDAQTLWSFRVRDLEIDLDVTMGVYQCIKEWKLLNREGRVIILIDDETLLPSKIADEADSPEIQTLLIRSCHQKLMDSMVNLKCLTPLYHYHIQFGAYGPTDFHRLSSLGPISWLLRRHHINVSQSLWIAPCPPNTPHSVPFGISYMSGTDFFATGGWDMESKIRKFAISNSSAPDWLSHVLTTGTKLSDEESSRNPAATIKPLEAERRAALEADPLSSSNWLLVKEDISFGLSHGCVFPPHDHTNKKRPPTMDSAQLSPSPKKSPPPPTHPSDPIEIRDSASITIVQDTDEL